MKIVVVGGTGRLGSQVVAELQGRGHEAVAAAPSTGFDTISGAGVVEGLTRRRRRRRRVQLAVVRGRGRARVLPDIDRRPCSRPSARSGSGITSCCRSSGPTVRRTAATCGRRWRRNELVEGGGVPYTIVRATQFFEFLGQIADSATTDGTVRVTSATLQPIAVHDLAVIVGGCGRGSTRERRDRGRRS